MATVIDAARVRALLPKRPEGGHKGTFGHVFVVAGSRGFTGAAGLAAEAAGRAGAGLVTVGCPAPLAGVMAGTLREAMWRPLPATRAETVRAGALGPALAFAADKDAVVLGPGLGQHRSTRRFVLDFVRACPSSMLVDADGLNLLSTAVEALDEAAGARVATPHPGEMARLTGLTVKAVQRARAKTAADFARAHGCVVVLKGAGTVVADAAGAVYENPTGNAGLATGGTGDVLAGVIGGLMAQGLAPVDAAVAGVYLHGLAGDVAAARLGQAAMLAGDVTAALGAAFRQVLEGS